MQRFAEFYIGEVTDPAIDYQFSNGAGPVGESFCRRVFRQIHARRDIAPQRLKQYQLLTQQLAQNLADRPTKLSANDSFETIFRLRFASLFSVIDKYLQAAPAKDFSLNTETGEIRPL